MTNFVNDNTALWDDKFDVNPVTIVNQQWGAADAKLAKSALLDLRSAVVAGVAEIIGSSFVFCGTGTSSHIEIRKATSAIREQVL